MAQFKFKKLRIRFNRLINGITGSDKENLTPLQSTACRIAKRIIRSRDSVIHTLSASGSFHIYQGDYQIKVSDSSITVSSKKSSYHVWIPRRESDSIRRLILLVIESRDLEAQKVHEDSALKGLQELYRNLK